MCFAVQERITIGELRLDNSSKASRGRFSVIQRRLRLPHASDEAKQAAAFRPFTYLFLLKKKGDIALLRIIWVPEVIFFVLRRKVSQQSRAHEARSAERKNTQPLLFRVSDVDWETTLFLSR